MSEEPRNGLVDAAQRYAARGWAVFPLHHMRQGACSCGNPECDKQAKHPRTKNGYKDASNNAVDIQGWWGNSYLAESNIGLPTGEGNGRIVLDIDPRHGGDKTLSFWRDELGIPIPDTLTARTGGGGLHLCYRYRPGLVSKALMVDGKPCGVDIKTDGGYVVLPPSNHLSGGTYTWIDETVPIAEMPDELFAHLAALCETEKQTPKKKNDTLGLAGSREGSRNEEMRDYVWRLVHTRGMREDEIRLLARTKWENTEQGDHPFPWEEAEAMIDRALGKVELQSPVEDADELVEFAANLHHTDMGAAEWIVRLYGDNLRYCYKWRRWLVWDGKRWTMDGEAQAMELAKQAVRKLQHAGLSIPDDTKRPALVKWALGLERHDAREKALADARSSLPIAADDLDRDPWLFNCANGTIDLRTGELRPHRREDYITKLSPFDYLPDAQCPAWVDHLRHIHDGDQEMVDFLQRAFGYSISGVTDERILFLAYGGGANGKTLTHETIAMVLADYALRASISVFLQKERGGVPNDVAALRGARFVYASEPDQGKRLAEGTIKDLTGGDTISARFLHGEFFTFKPACKLWLGTNHRLTVRGTDEAIWDRIREIPYVVSIPRAKRLPREAMLEIFQREGSGILAWLIQGCLAWQREGLKMPQKVVEATNAYREEQDALGMFLAECCERRKGAQCAYATLYQVYQEYCEEMGDEPCKRKGFTTRLREKGIVTDKGTGNQTICLDVKLLGLPRERLKVVNYQ